MCHRCASTYQRCGASAGRLTCRRTARSSAHVASSSRRSSDDARNRRPVIISRTPFRVSFVGGGTDLPEFYTRSPGTVISMAVDRYVYITVNRRFDETLRLSYSKTEIVDRLDCVAHPLFREALRVCGLHQGIEATSIADIPSGTGL